MNPRVCLDTSSGMLAWVALAPTMQTQLVGAHLKNVSQIFALYGVKLVGLYSSEHGLFIDVRHPN